MPCIPRRILWRARIRGVTGVGREAVVQGGEASDIGERGGRGEEMGKGGIAEVRCYGGIAPGAAVDEAVGEGYVLVLGGVLAVLKRWRGEVI